MRKRPAAVVTPPIALAPTVALTLHRPSIPRIRCKGGLTLGTDCSGADTPAWAARLLNIEREHVSSSDTLDSCRRVSRLLGVKRVFENITTRALESTPYVDLYVVGPPCQSRMRMRV